MNAAIRQEIEQLKTQAPNGLLRAERIVEFALTHPDSALHREFEWDNEEAARRFRLSQARQLIRAYVIALDDTPRRYRGLISVPTDRTQGGGYRETEKVRGMPAQRLQLILEALGKAERLRNSYAYLPELTPFFDELELLVRKHQRMLEAPAAAVA